MFNIIYLFFIIIYQEFLYFSICSLAVVVIVVVVVVVYFKYTYEHINIQDNTFLSIQLCSISDEFEG